jgi:hypothetical protein
MRALQKNEGDTYGSPVFHLFVVPLFNRQNCTNSNEHSLYIRFLMPKALIFARTNLRGPSQGQILNAGPRLRKYKKCKRQGTLTEGRSAVQLTSLY